MKIFFTILVLISLLFIRDAILLAEQEQYVNIKIYNTYISTFSLLAKCDWNNKTKSFDFEKVFTLKGKSGVNIRMNKKYNNCEIWGRLEKLF